MSARAFLRTFAPALTLATAALTVACADDPTSPDAGLRPMPARAVPADLATPTGLHLSIAGLTDTARTTFVVTPGQRTVVTLGTAVRIQLAPDAACDPARASYGPGTWDLPCAPLTTPLTVSVKAWRTSSGQPRLQFSPDLRFVPGTSNTVWVATRQLGIGRDYRLDWCPTGAGACVDERLDDPSALAAYDSVSGILGRRIKHFSGYTVVAN